MKPTTDDNHWCRRSALGGLAALSLGGCALPAGVAPDQHIMRIDLATKRLIQLIGQAQPDGDSVGAYADASTSPAFARIGPHQALELATGRLGKSPQTFVNAAFFETYDAATQLAFPVIMEGQLLTGGASPFGPRPSPAHPHYTGVQLHGLAWNSTGCAILPWDPKATAGAGFGGFSDVVVSYDWADHPAIILSGDPVNRYVLAGVSGAGTVLLGVFCGQTLTASASLMRQAGAQGTILTLDGGRSTTLWTQHAGWVERPRRAGLPRLGMPHYLAVTDRDDTGGATDQ